MQTIILDKEPHLYNAGQKHELAVSALWQSNGK